MEHAKISHQNISRGIFAFVFGALLFLLLATLILETSGLEIILFLSQNEDSVNTKCKVELREVLQQVVSLHWNKCWFVQKKKKKHAPLDLVSLDFLFPFFAKEMRALDFSNLLTQLWGITGRLLQCALPADVLDLLAVLGAGLGPVLGTHLRQGNGSLKSSAHRYCVWPPALLCGAAALFLSCSTPFYSVKACSKKLLLQGSPEGVTALPWLLTVF